MIRARRMCKSKIETPKRSSRTTTGGGVNDRFVDPSSRMHMYIYFPTPMHAQKVQARTQGRNGH